MQIDDKMNAIAARIAILDTMRPALVEIAERTNRPMHRNMLAALLPRMHQDLRRSAQRHV